MGLVMVVIRILADDDDLDIIERSVTGPVRRLVLSKMSVR